MRVVWAISIIASILIFALVLSQNTEALKSEGNPLTEISSKQVCGNFLCGEPLSIPEKIAAYLLSLAQQEEPETNILQQAFLPPGSFSGERMTSPIPELGKPIPDFRMDETVGKEIRKMPTPELAPKVTMAPKSIKSLDVKQITPRDVKASELAGRLIKQYDLKQEKIFPAVRKIIEEFQLVQLDKEKITQMRIVQKELGRTKDLPQCAIQTEQSLPPLSIEVNQCSNSRLVTAHEQATLSVDCVGGYELVGGGHSSESYINILSSYPDSDSRWILTVVNPTDNGIWVEVYVLCAKLVGESSNNLQLDTSQKSQSITYSILVYCDGIVVSGGFSRDSIYDPAFKVNKRETDHWYAAPWRLESNPNTDIYAVCAKLIGDGSTNVQLDIVEKFQTFTVPQNVLVTETITCDSGYTLIGGGFGGIYNSYPAQISKPASGSSWTVGFYQSSSQDKQVIGQAICAKILN